MSALKGGGLVGCSRDSLFAGDGGRGRRMGGSTRFGWDRLGDAIDIEGRRASSYGLHSGRSAIHLFDYGFRA